MIELDDRDEANSRLHGTSPEILGNNANEPYAGHSALINEGPMNSSSDASGSTVRRMGATDIAQRERRTPSVLTPSVLLTDYAHTAAIADQRCDLVLIGDSLGMVMHDSETAPRPKGKKR